MIDTHVHLGQLRFDDPGLTPSKLLRWMDQQTPMIDYLKNAPLSKDAFERISRKNAEKVFQL